ncbi:MAG: ATP-binding protein [Proteobacteria bacterium]|nr:ATP-binding protein [Pseudomonadota bacterium]
MERTPSLPTNSRIAVALLDALDAQQRRESRMRVLAALGRDEARLRAEAEWLPTRDLLAAVEAAGADRALGRQLGMRLVGETALGWHARRAGLGSVAKAYRRVDLLLPREGAEAGYEVLGLRSNDAEVVYHPGPGDGTHAALCGMREGLLAALPTRFGQVAARVREVQCVSEGAGACRYAVVWRPASRSGLLFGAVAGAGLGLLAGMAVGAGTGVAVGLGAIAVGGFGGHTLDLWRRLQARGALSTEAPSWLAEVEETLAHRLDELAKLSSRVDDATTGSRPAVRARESDDETEVLAPVAARLGRELRGPLAKLRARLDRIASGLRDDALEPAELTQTVESCREDVRRLQPVADELRQLAAGHRGGPRERLDLVSLVRDTAALFESGVPKPRPVELDLAADLPPVRGEPLHLEQLLLQLLRNASDASDGSEGARLSLARAPEGVELCVADAGHGMEQHTVDEVFDPFFDRRPAGAEQGLGLAIAYRIVEEHGGELHVESRAGEGTRVRILLPADATE